MAYETIRNELTQLMKWKLADRFIEERLDYVNEGCKPVKYSETIYSKYVKRMFDIVISGTALFVTAPINILVAIITYFDVGKPIMFEQERIGKNGNTFTLKKFRNMTNEKGPSGELLPPNMRVTKWGKFVRKTSIDELLNFWYVLKGDMSIIGPRPLDKPYYKRFNNRHLARFYVKPGLECPPRHFDIGIRTWNEQFENDVWYVENLSFKTDIKMLINLFRYTFNSSNSNLRSTAKRGDFIGYSLDGVALNQYDIPDDYIEWISKEFNNKE